MVYLYFLMENDCPKLQNFNNMPPLGLYNSTLQNILQLKDLHVMKPSNMIFLCSFFNLSIDDDPSIQNQFFLVLILDDWSLHNFLSFHSMYCCSNFSNL
jgi:hypothetical protein